MVSFTLVHAGKYRIQDKNTDDTQTKHNTETANETKHSKYKTTAV